MRLVRFAAAAAAAMSLASTAQASTFVVTFTGTVSSGTDGAGIFGTAGADLTGLAYTATYLVDDATVHEEPNGYSVAEGGAYYGTVTPIVTSELTINGVSQAAVQPQYGGYLSQNAVGFYTGLYYWRLSLNVVGDSPGDALYNTCGSYGTVAPSIACLGGNPGYFRFGNGATLGQLTVESAVSTSPQSLSTSYVPEPATWAMMITGFGMAGVSLRRRPTAVAAA